MKESGLAQDVFKRVLGFSNGFRELGDRALGTDIRRTTYVAAQAIHRFKISLKDRPDVWRIIDIKGKQILSSLHKAIFKAFDHVEKHQYSFFLSNRPYDKESFN